MKNGVWLEDFRREKHYVNDFEGLCKLKDLFEDQRIQRARERLGSMGDNLPDMEPDNLVDWLVKRGICPHALASANSKYHFENSVLLDGEMGLKLPDPNLSLGDTPQLFFQSLNIVRAERTKIKEEEKDQR